MKKSLALRFFFFLRSLFQRPMTSKSMLSLRAEVKFLREINSNLYISNEEKLFQIEQLLMEIKSYKFVEKNTLEVPEQHLLYSRPGEAYAKSVV